MRLHQGTIGVLILALFVFSIATFAQESTEEPEATEAVVAETTPEAESTAEPDATAEEDVEEPAASSTTYVIRPGDTLFRIARQFNVSLQAIATANNITNPSRIFSGQTLVIPQGQVSPQPATPAPTAVPTTTPPTDADTTTYTVQRGDTLFRIALNNRTTVAQLASLNNITNPSLIFVGQRLQIPARPAVSATPTPPPATEDTTAVVPATDILDGPMSRGIEVFIVDQDANALVSQVSQLGFTWVKIVINWRVVEAEEGVLELAAYDTAINAFAEANIKVMLTLTGAPDWARPAATDFVKGLRGDYGPPDDVATFGAFAGAIAARYGDKVQAYEIWVEPNLRRTWISADTTGANNARISPIRYIDLLTSAHNNIKEANPSALIVTGGLAPTGLNDNINAIDDRLFLRELLRQGVANVSDAMGAQPDGFANPPDLTCCEQAPGVDTHFDDERFFFLDTLNAYRTIISQSTASTLPIWVTRFGWGTAEGNAIESPNMNEEPYLTYTSPSEQAIYIPRAYRLGDETGYVEAMFLYNLNGCQANIGEACYYSLIDSSNGARPAFVSVQSSNAE